MKRNVTKLVTMLLVTIALMTIVSGVAFITNDPTVGYIKSVMIDSITDTVCWIGNVIHHN